jgi:hypothetical protein
MGDTVQIAIVTTAAAAALIVLVRPYLRRSSAPTAPACANCKPASRVVSRPIRIARRPDLSGQRRQAVANKH